MGRKTLTQPKIFHNKKINSNFCDTNCRFIRFCEPSKSSSNKSLHPVDAPFPVRQPETCDSGSLGDAPFAQELHAEGGLLACRALTSMVETINHGEDGASGDVKAQ